MFKGAECTVCTVCTCGLIGQNAVSEQVSRELRCEFTRRGGGIVKKGGGGQNTPEALASFEQRGRGRNKTELDSFISFEDSNKVLNFVQQFGGAREK